MAGATESSKIRILCLHGIGTNSEIFEAQTAALRYQLGDLFEFDFIDGSYPWPAARGIKEVFGEDQVCYSYFDGSGTGALQTVQELADYVAESGPFHAVMGFSMGAALAMTLLLHHKQIGSVDPPFQFAILLCSTLPCDWNALQAGTLLHLHPGEIAAPIKIPTVHFWSPVDNDYPGESHEVVDMCDVATRVDLVHDAGHNIPSNLGGVLRLAQAICAAADDCRHGHRSGRLQANPTCTGSGQRAAGGGP